MNEEGSTKPFAIIPSNIWDGKDENGNPVSSANLLYRLEADWIRVNPSNNKVKLLGTIIPHCGPLSVDTGCANHHQLLVLPMANIETHRPQL